MSLPRLWDVFLVSDILEYIGIPIFFALCFGHEFVHGRREACGVGIGEMDMDENLAELEAAEEAVVPGGGWYKTWKTAVT